MMPVEPTLSAGNEDIKYLLLSSLHRIKSHKTLLLDRIKSSATYDSFEPLCRAGAMVPDCSRETRAYT